MNNCWNFALFQVLVVISCLLVATLAHFVPYRHRQRPAFFPSYNAPRLPPYVASTPIQRPVYIRNHYTPSFYSTPVYRPTPPVPIRQAFPVHQAVPVQDVPSYREPEYSTPGAYQYSYAVNDDYHGTNFAHSENRNDDKTYGEYRVALPDGRTQIVSYSADDLTGYVADVRYEGQARYDSYGPSPVAPGQATTPFVPSYPSFRPTPYSA